MSYFLLPDINKLEHIKYTQQQLLSNNESIFIVELSKKKKE